MRLSLSVFGSVLLTSSAFATTPDMSSMYASAMPVPAPITSAAPTMASFPDMTPAPTTPPPSVDAIMGLMAPIVISDSEMASIDAEVDAIGAQVDAAVAAADAPDDDSTVGSSSDDSAVTAMAAPTVTPSQLKALQEAVRKAGLELIKAEARYTQLQMVCATISAKIAELQAQLAICTKNGDAKGIIFCNTQIKKGQGILQKAQDKAVDYKQNKLWPAQDKLKKAEEALAKAMTALAQQNMPQ